MVVSKDTNIKLVYNVIRLFRFIDTKGLFTLRWGTHHHHHPTLSHLSLKRDQFEFHSTKQTQPLADSWSRDLD